MYVCERGPREGSLDYFLFNKAISLGVEFRFNEPFNKKDSENKQVIISTGLSIDTYEKLNLPYTNIFGYRGILRMPDNKKLITYMLKCTGYDFAYLASKNGLMFILLFSRNELAQTNLKEFEDILLKTENIKAGKWISSYGAIPNQVNLFHGDYILAGTLSGMIDPFVLHGISGALTSGRVAAYAVSDRAKAEKDFLWLTRNYKIKKKLKKISASLPFKSFTIPIMMYMDAHFRGVGFVR
jgi:flavin-dependent dehydrogenase